MDERDKIIASHRQRLQARETLKVQVDEAKTELNPRIKMDRWITDRKSKASAIATRTGKIAKQNTPLIGAVSIGALIFFNRRNISKWLSNLKKPTSTIED